jgi:tetratricopeptide (TPR) repeat protein
LILLLYVLLFEADGVSGNLRKWAGALRAILAALALAGAGGYLLARMQPKPAGNWADSPFLYRITQPFVALHYFKEFFLPTDLSIDAGWGSVRPLSLQAVAGYAFVLGMVGVALAASRTRRGRPVAFGILWFLAALLPTSLTPLADVTNDHRMFFPFVGLTLAVCWSLRLALFRQTAGLTANPGWVRGAAVAVMALLAVEGVGTWHRNQVWFTDESLWHDAILKNPRDSKAWTNYGIVFLAQGDYETALPSLQRAAALDPSNSAAQVGLVNALVQLHRNDEVAPHFQRLLDLNPPKPDAYIAYAEWLNALGRLAESGALLERAARLYPPTVELRQARLVYFLARDAAGRIAAIGALDANHDTILSAGELLNAPAVLRGLDRNGDGKLSAEECGAHFREAAKLDPESLRRARRQFMESQPVLRALDTNRDGEISAGEIDAADRELATLDANGDGQLEPEEYLPECVVAAARGILALLDPHHEGRIDGAQRRSAAAEGFRGLLDAADVDGDGTVTLTELTNEIFYRADLHKDGMVTAGELAEAARLGLLGTVPLAAAATLPAGTAGRPPR